MKSHFLYLLTLAASTYITPVSAQDPYAVISGTSGPCSTKCIDCPNQAYELGPIINAVASFVCLSEFPEGSCYYGNSTGCTPPLGKSVTTPFAYIPGWAGFHIQLFQRNEGPPSEINPSGGSLGNSNYRFNISIFDEAQNWIGGVHQLIDAAPNVIIYIGGAMPYVAAVWVGEKDSDGISFQYPAKYNGQEGGPVINTTKEVINTKKDKDCKMGEYDHGSAQGDCGFPLPAPDDNTVIH